MELTKLRGWIKRLNTKRLDDHSRELLDGCFPGFVGQQEIADSLKGASVRLQLTSKEAIPTGQGRLRRFAGDETLPGGRYYSLCEGASGSDSGTLVWELMTYWTSKAKFFPNLIDSTVHQEEALELRNAQPEVFGSAHFLLLGASEIGKVSLVDGKPQIQLGKQIGKVLPLEVSEATIDRVIDLRKPATQRWFADHFGRLEVEAGNTNEFRIVTAKKMPESFGELLPTLMTPTPGGNAFHQAVGQWLRNRGVFGLVFPSARRNGVLDSTEDEIVDFDGWNFVFYHDSPATKGRSLFGVQPKWLREGDAGVAIEGGCFDERRSRWRLSGPEEGERRRYDLEWIMRATGRSESVVWNTRFGSRES